MATNSWMGSVLVDFYSAKNYSVFKGLFSFIIRSVNQTT